MNPEPLLPLDAIRRPPEPAFTEALRTRLRRQPIDRPRHLRTRLGRIAAGLAVAAGVGFAVTLPSVRASAASFLALFREVNFVAIPLQSDAPLKRADGLDLPHLIGERVQILEDAGPTAVTSPEQAGSVAGFDVRMPAYLPEATVRTQIVVGGRHAARITADVTRLRQVLDAVGINDVEIPDDLDGEAAMVRIAPMVMTDFAQGERTASLMQGPMPEVLLPAGLDLAKVGEIGLRLLGMAPVEAREFAKSVDWRTTLPVPVPPTAAQFRHTLVGSSKGMVIEGPLVDPETKAVRGNWNLVLWSAGGRVYAIRSTMRLADVLQMANSIP